MSRRADLRAIIRGKCISDAATDAAVDALMEYLAVPCGYGCAEPCHPGDSDPARFVEALAERVHRLYDGVPAGQAVAAETAVRGALDRHYPRLLDGKSHATGHQCETTDDCVADITASALAARGDAVAEGAAMSEEEKATCQPYDFGWSDGHVEGFREGVAQGVRDAVHVAHEALVSAVRERDEARREADRLRDRLIEFAMYCRWSADGGTEKPGWLHIAGRVDDILSGEAPK